MKIKNKIRNSLLAAAVVLAVSGGSAYAMPSGGTVTMGDVTNVANPAEIMTANANSIINWDSFSVGVGEKVTFDTQKFMVLNRVVGGHESQILGMLSDQGEGKLILINPSGIVLGENSVINANDLVLSTLRLSDSEFKDLVNGNSVAFKDEYYDRGRIEIKSGSNLTLNEALRLYGGKIIIADGVEIISKDNSSANIDIAAGVREITDLREASRLTYDEGTNVEIGDANIGTMSNPISNIIIKAAKTTLDKTDIIVNGNNNSQHNILIGSTVTNINSSKLLNRRGDIFIANISRGSWSYDKDGSIKTFEANADPNYEVSIKNSNINTEKEKDITIIGGNVTLDHSQLNSGKDIFVGAVKTYDSKEGVRTATTYDSSIINADKDTVVHARGYAEAYGANLNIHAKRFDNVIDSTNPIVKYIGKNDVSLWELMPYIDKEENINLDYYYNNLNGKTLGELIMMALENRKNGIVDEKLDATIEYLQKKLNEQEEGNKKDNVPRLTPEQFDEAVSAFFTSEEKEKVRNIIKSGELIDVDDNVLLIKKYNILLEKSGYKTIFGKELEAIDLKRSAIAATATMLQEKSMEQFCDAMGTVAKVIGKFNKDLNVTNFVGDGTKILSGLEKVKNSTEKDFAGNFISLMGNGLSLSEHLIEAWDKLDDKTKASVIENEEFAKSLGILSTSCDLIGLISKATDNFTSLDNLFDNTGAIINKTGDLGVGISKVVFKDSPLFKKEAGILTPADIYLSIGKAGVNFVGETINSIKKNREDGKWDTNDTSDTMIRSSLTGLNTLAHCLSLGLDEVIYNAFDAVTGNKSDKSHLEQAIEGYEKLGQLIGNKIGSWVLDLQNKNG